MDELDSPGTQEVFPPEFIQRHEALAQQLGSIYTDAGSTIFPDVIFHYTSADAFLSIIDRSELWASNALYLNDAAELEIGISIYQGIIEGARQAKGGSHSDRVSSIFDSSPGLIGMIRKSSNYVCCLSAEGNQLSQWRAYSGNGLGYSIGFSCEGIRTLRFKKTKLILLRVLYEQKDQANLLLQTVASFGAYVDSLRQDVWDNDKNRLILQYAMWIHLCLLSMKLGAFREEKEWRLVLLGWEYPTPKCSFRALRSGLIVPYVAIKGDDQLLPIKKIFVGPTQYPEIAIRSIDQLLRKKNYANIEIEFCHTPLRAL